MLDKNGEQAFNETLKRMLKTPPKPHEKAVKDKPAKPKRKVTEKPQTQQS